MNSLTPFACQFESTSSVHPVVAVVKTRNRWSNFDRDLVPHLHFGGIRPSSGVRADLGLTWGKVRNIPMVLGAPSPQLSPAVAPALAEADRIGIIITVYRKHAQVATQ